jgi:Holliday junction DNA helicase RuvA
MISKITGRLIQVEGDVATLQIDAFEYSVFIPEFTRRQIQTQRGKVISLHTIQYLEGNPAQGRLTPRLLGFLNVAEREFFELFCLVDGVGMKKALRAIVRPVNEVALLIEEQDVKGLSALPGIGPATAERIVAKLRRKVPKFALLVAAPLGDAEVPISVYEEGFQILKSLGHGDSEARRLLAPIMESKKKVKDVDELIREVYAQQHRGGA